MSVKDIKVTVKIDDVDRFEREHAANALRKLAERIEQGLADIEDMVPVVDGVQRRIERVRPRWRLS